MACEGRRRLPQEDHDGALYSLVPQARSPQESQPIRRWQAAGRKKVEGQSQPNAAPVAYEGSSFHDELQSTTWRHPGHP